MKLATKKFFHNLMAMVVSVCMICTLTPSVAWATGSANSSWDEGSGTASASSEVKAKVINSDYSFNFITEAMNYDSKDDFVKAITGGHPLQATMKDAGIPDSYTVEWFIQEAKENENYDSTKAPSKDNPKTILVGEATKIFSKQYTKANTPKTNTVPTFEYPNQGNDGVIVAPSALSMNGDKRYEFSIIMTDADGAEAHASTQISLLADYPRQVVVSEDYPEVSVKGDIYQDFKIPPAVSVIEVTPIPEGSQTFQDINKEAANHTPVSETIDEAIQIDLVNDALDPDVDNPYEGTLEVRIPLPDSLKNADPAPAKGDTVNVYVMDEDGKVIVKKGTIDEALDENGDPIIDPKTGEPIPVVVVEISGTGSGLGTFAVGIPVGGTYNVTTIAQSGGMITPSSDEGGTIKMPLGGSSTFSTYAATPGYIFNGFEMRVGGSIVALRAEDLGFNTVTINPANYPAITEGSTVTLTAKYSSVALGRGNIGVSASLINGAGAGGDYKISTIETNTIRDRTVTPTAKLNTTNIDMAAGLLLEFRPNNSSRIKSVTINGNAVAVQGDSLMIGAAASDLDIVVEYEKGQREVPTTKESIDISVGKRPNGTMPAQLVNPSTGEMGSALNLEVGPGGTVYFEATPIKDEYVLKEVLVYSPAGSNIPVNVYDHVTPSPNSNGEYPNDKITLYNVVNDVEIELKYELLPGVFEPVEPSEGGEWGWIIPDNAANRNAGANAKPMMAKARAAAAYANVASTYSGSVSRAGDTLHKGQFQLNQGERARLVIYPEKGYELSDVYINGDPVKSLLKPYTDNDGNSYYALTVYRGEPGSADGQGAWTGDGFSGEQVDQIYYASGSVSTTTVKFSPAVIPIPQYVTIFTSVTDFGGGSITPNMRIVGAGQDVPNAGKAVVEFFPDDGYKVDKVWLGDDEVPSYDSMLTQDMLQLKLEGITLDQRVRVQFAPGDQQNRDKKRVSVLATAGAGGSISPAGNFQVYEGSDQSFFIAPSTGYAISRLSVKQGGTALSEDAVKALYTTRNTISISNINKDTDIQVTFESTDASAVSSYTVSTDKEGQGRISPVGPLTVGAGTDVPFTIIPTDGWYVKEIRAIYPNSNNANGLNLISLYDTDTFAFTLADVRSNATVKVIFGEGEDGKIPGTDEDLPTPPGDDDIIKLNPDNQNILPTDKPGAVVSPSLGEIEVVKNPDGPGATAPVVLTVTVADGYELKNPGIVVKDGDKNITEKVTIDEVGDGVYAVTVPKENVTPDLKVEVTTEPKSSSSNIAETFDVELSVVGDGYITPGMQKVGDKTATLKVEKGKGQTFSFIPGDGWKLFTVYLNGKPTTLTGNTLTVSNIQQKTTIEAAFSKLGPDEKPPVLPTMCNVIVTKSGDGNVSPMATADAPIQVFAGSNMTINVQPGTGNKVTATVGSTEVPVIGNTVQLTNITAKTTTVNIKFEKDVETEYRTLTVVSSGPGTTSPAGTSLVVKGKTQVMTFIPDAGKKLESVTVDGNDRINNVIASGTMSLDLGAINNNMNVVVKFCDSSELPENDPRQDLPKSDFKYWTVTASVPNGGGVLSPGSAKVGNGGQLVFTAIPSSGYVLESVKVDNKPFTNIADNKTFTLTGITGDRNVVASFKKKNAVELDEFYSVFVSSNAGGSVSPTGAMTVPAGGSQSITIMPDPGYKVGSIAVGGQPPITNFTSSSYTLFNITQDTNVVVSFTPLKPGESGTSVLTHDITTSSTVNGHISPEGVTKVADGKNASFTFVPDDGCKLSYVRIDDTDIPGDYIVNNQYIFTDVKGNHSLHAVFIKDDGTKYWTVNVGQSANGSITPSERVVVPDKEDTTFTITPFYGYRIKNIYIGDTAISGAAFIQPNFSKVDVAEGVSYQYSNRVLKLTGLQKNAEISATFEKDPSYYPGGDDDVIVPDYTPISGSTTANPSNSGAGGTTSIGSGGFLEDPGTGASGEEKKPQVTVVPNPGSMVDKVEVNYGDGSKTVIDDDGTFEYDKDGNLVYSNGTPVLDNDGSNIKYPNQGSPARPTYNKPDAKQIYEQGYVTVDAEKAAETGGVSVDVTFRPITSDEESNLTKPTYYEINAAYSGGGRMYPDGRVKVAKGQNMIFQMLPSSGYELAALSVDGQDAMKDVTNSRKYIFKNVQGNRSINAAFGFVNNDMIQRHKVTASSNATNGPGVSPTDVSVPDGSDVVVYFLPPENQKVDRVRVTKGGSNVLLDSTSYTNTMYTATNIDGDIHVEVTYAPAGEGDYTWTVQPVRITSDAPHGNGSVSPTEAYVPAGSPQTFFFTPDAGYVVDYVMFNGVATTLKNNPSSYSVTPSPDVNAENRLDVFFRPATPQDKQYTTITPEILPGTDGKVHATIEPTSMNVEVGSSVDFYVSPATGHTIKSVKVDGWDVPFKPALPDGQTAVSGAVYSTYIVTLDNIQPGAKIEVETETTSKTPIEIKKHTLTVTGTNVMYTPMGSMELPEGGTQIITVNPLPGYYLDSIMVTENGQQTDITGQLVNDTFTVEMGAYDKLVEIKYLEVGGSEQATPAYITIGSTKTEDGRDVYATISMQRDGEELINVLSVDPVTRKLVDADGNPIEFVRGGNYTFYASAEPLDGKNLILSGAKFNDAAQNVPSLTGMIANLKVNASGVLDLVFRELKPGEKPIVTRQFNVRFDIVGGLGSIDPSTALTGITVPMGDSTGPIRLTPGDEHWMIESVVEYSLDNDGYKIGTGRPVDARKYKDETYDCTPMTDTLVEVTFVQCAIVDVQWDKTLGFVAPNPATDYLKLPVEKTGEPFQFIVAPFENCYVNRFDVTPEEGDTVSYLQDLRQTESVAQYISNGGYSVVSFNPGVGVETPEGSGEGGEAAMSTFAIQARAVDGLDVDPIENFGFIPTKGTAMQNVYGVQANLHPSKTTVDVGLYTLNRDQYYTITPKVKLASDGKPHGEIVPSIPIQVSTTDNTTFRFVPENSNYAVKNVFIDGSPVANAAQLTSYTLSNVTHDTIIEVEFAPRSSENSSRLLRVASSLARTGDLTGPAVGALLIVAALGLAVTAVSYIRRQQRRRRRMQGMQ